MIHGGYGKKSAPLQIYITIEFHKRLLTFWCCLSKLLSVLLHLKGHFGCAHDAELFG